MMFVDPNPIDDVEAAEEEEWESIRRRKLGTSGLYFGPISGAEHRYADLVEQAERNYGPDR